VRLSFPESRFLIVNAKTRNKAGPSGSDNRGLFFQYASGNRPDFVFSFDCCGSLFEPMDLSNSDSVLMVGVFLILFGGYMLWTNFLSPNREKT
jgi:hypothetical protein